jgi:hypothetical protein
MFAHTEASQGKGVFRYPTEVATEVNAFLAGVLREKSGSVTTSAELVSDADSLTRRP